MKRKLFAALIGINFYDARTAEVDRHQGDATLSRQNCLAVANSPRDPPV
jgi:hypothetical protein